MNIDLAPHQMKFLQSDAKFSLLAGGVGSGKTWAGSHYVIGQATQNNKAQGFIGANSYKQLNNSTLACLFAELDAAGIPYSYNMNRGYLSALNAKILCVSMDNYNAVRGIEIGWYWLDEVRDTKKEAFEVIQGRLRDPKSKALQGRLTSSPAGYNWLYDYFVDTEDNDYQLIEASSHDNPHLPDGYIDSLKGSYDEKMYEQEVLGKFVNLTQGSIYYAFDRNKNLSETNYDPSQRVWIGMDFNINPMTAVLAHIEGNKIKVFDEIWIMGSNTKEMGAIIKERYGSGLSIVPDSTGKALKTSSSGLTDHLILERMGFKILGTRNPFRVDRYNCVNNMLEKSLIEINPRCRNLIRDLEQTSYKEGTSSPDTTKDKTLTHVTDALGYLSWFVNPLIEREPIRMIPR